MAIDPLAGSTVASYIAKRWGRAVRTLPPATVAVQTTPTQLCRNNPRRFVLTIINLTTGDAYELFNNAPSTTFGFRIAALGGSITYSADEDGELVTYDHWAVMPNGPLNLVVVEVETS